DGVAQVRLGVALQLLQNACRDLLRRVLLAVDVELPVGAHVALDRGDRLVDVRDGLALRGLADENLAVLRERDDRGGRAKTLGVGDDLRLATLENGNDRVRRSEVDTHSTCHDLLRFVEELARLESRWLNYTSTSQTCQKS